MYLVLSGSSLGYRLYCKEDGLISLHPKRGKVFYQGTPIVVGDEVELDKDGFIVKILPRKNILKRPHLANADIMLVLISLKQPDFSSYLLDKYLTATKFSSIKSAIVLTKADLCSKEEVDSIQKRMEFYRNIGYSVYLIDAHEPTEFDFMRLKSDIKDKKVALMGQTGVGKSSLINSLFPGLERKVDQRSVRIGRGRHTTKEVVLLPYPDGFLFDTAGFSELELEDLRLKDLAFCFPGYEAYFSECYFNDCLHLESTKGCKVIEKVHDGTLSDDSYKNYCKIYEEVKVNDVWKKKKP